MTGQRTLALLLLLVAGIFSLPVAPYFFDSPGTENFAMIVGALVGVVMALIGIVIFFLLLNGFSGA
ncbi:hypothetical protein BH18ACT5_BH18ACT5_12210 [soil metagenome]